MMKNLLFTLGLMIAYNTQAQEFEWVSTVKGSELSYIKGHVNDADGNTYVMGLFEGTADFDPSDATFNLTSVGEVDVFVEKLNSAGELIWAVSFGGEEDDIPNGIAVDTDGNCYTTGSFRGTVDFDPSAGTLNLTAPSHTNTFIQKLNADGELIWARGFGDSGEVSGVSITTDAAGNCYSTGTFTGWFDIDPADDSELIISTGMISTYFQKLNSAGELELAGQFETAPGAIVKATDIAVDASNNIIICGNFGGTIDFDPAEDSEYNVVNAGLDDGFVTKLDADGGFEWTLPYQSTSYDYAASTTTDAAGNVYVAGGFRGTTDFDPNGDGYDLTAIGSYDIFTQKLSPGGEMIWTNTHGGTDLDLARHIVIDNESNCYVIGDFAGTVDFDPSGAEANLTGPGQYVQKLDADGNLILVNNGNGNRISIDAESNYYTSGFYGDFDGTTTVDFDPSDGIAEETTIETYDGFVVKFNSGCSVDNTVSIAGITLTAEQDGATYQWVDCDDSNAPIPGATDQSFTPASNGNYAVEVTFEGCMEISVCTTISTVGIDDNNIILNVYPNPTNGMITVQTNQNIKSIEIYNLAGQPINKSLTNQIDLTDLANGVYIIKITGDLGTSIKKVNKN